MYAQAVFLLVFLLADSAKAWVMFTFFIYLCWNLIGHERFAENSNVCLGRRMCRTIEIHKGILLATERQVLLWALLYLQKGWLKNYFFYKYYVKLGQPVRQAFILGGQFGEVLSGRTDGGPGGKTGRLPFVRRTGRRLFLWVVFIKAYIL